MDDSRIIIQTKGRLLAAKTDTDVKDFYLLEIKDKGFPAATGRGD